MIVLDHYDEAVWINVAVFGGNAESGFYWQKIHPGKTLKFYADKGAWEELKKMGRARAGPAAAKEVPPSSTTDLMVYSVRARTEPPRHFLGQEASGNGWLHGKDAEHSSLASRSVLVRMRAKQAARRRSKSSILLRKCLMGPPMQYDVLIHGRGKPVAGLVPLDCEVEYRWRCPLNSVGLYL